MSDISFEEFLSMILGVLEKANVDYMIGGAVGVWPWGEPRSTQDIDMVINIEPEDCERLSRELEKIDIFLPADIILENLEETRADLAINAIHGASGFKAEMFPIRANDEYRNLAFSRRLKVDFGDNIGDVFVHAPEDLIIYKILFFSLGMQTKHIRDIVSILHVVGEQLDYQYIDKWVKEKSLQSIWEEIQRAASSDTP